MLIYIININNKKCNKTVDKKPANKFVKGLLLKDLKINERGRINVEKAFQFKEKEFIKSSISSIENNQFNTLR